MQPPLQQYHQRCNLQVRRVVAALATLAAVATAVADAAVAVAPTTVLAALAALATPFEELHRMHLLGEFRRILGYVLHMCRLPTTPLQIRPHDVLRS